MALRVCNNHVRFAGCFLLCLLAAVLPVLAGGGGSVLQAVQAISQQPYAQSSSFVQIKGERGDPMPSEWIVLLADPSARGGVREVTIVNGQITSERTPLRGFSDAANAPAISSSKIVMDADAIFRAVQKEAVASRIGFDSLNYQLKSDPQSNSPVWTVKLYDNAAALIGTLGISAQNGQVTQGLVLEEGVKPESNTKHPGGLVGAISETSQNAARKAQKSPLRFIGNVQEALVGERTIGVKDGE